MKGIRTCFVLGAGASRAYTKGGTPMPLQKDIAAALFASSGLSRDGDLHLGGFAVGHGLTYSTRLKSVLCALLDLDWPRPPSLVSFWQQLQDRGYTLESMYREVEEASTGRYSWVAPEFMALVLTTVANSTKRDLPNVCDLHRQLALNFEPGDVVVNFNWDTLASDALYHHSKFWFASTGFGLAAHPIAKTPMDASRMRSQVLLLQVHGSVALYSALDESDHETQTLVYLPPDTYNSMSSMINTLRIEGQPNALRDMTDIESDRFAWGWIKMPRDGPWLRPLFVAPSTSKPEYKHWYHQGVVRVLHSCLPFVDRFVIAGYSAPEADIAYLSNLFPSAVLDEHDVTIVNPSNDDLAFRARLESVFPRATRFDYSTTDFSTFCSELSADARSSSGSLSPQSPTD